MIRNTIQEDDPLWNTGMSNLNSFRPLQKLFQFLSTCFLFSCYVNLAIMIVSVILSFDKRKTSESHSKTMLKLGILATLSIWACVGIGSQHCVGGLAINNSSIFFQLAALQRIKPLLVERILIEFLAKIVQYDWKLQMKAPLQVNGVTQWCH